MKMMMMMIGIGRITHNDLRNSQAMMLTIIIRWIETIIIDSILVRVEQSKAANSPVENDGSLF